MRSRLITNNRVRRIAALLPALTVVLAIQSCNTSNTLPTQPTQESAASFSLDFVLGRNHSLDVPSHRGQFFPMAIGNCWTYRGSFSTHIEGDPFLNIGLFMEQRKLTGTEDLFGRTYVVEEQKRWFPLFPWPPTDSNTVWVRYRQDRAGLYEADVPLNQSPNSRVVTLAHAGKSERSRNMGVLANWYQLEAHVLRTRGEGFLPAVQILKRKIQSVHAALRHTGLRHPGRTGRPPGGVLPDELTRLKYPLRPGQEWTIRSEPMFTARVERREVLNLPAGRMRGIRIRILIEGLNPEDEVFIWYGREGFLKMSYHLESVATDNQGNPIGTLISEEYSLLETVELVSRRP